MGHDCSLHTALQYLTNLAATCALERIASVFGYFRDIQGPYVRFLPFFLLFFQILALILFHFTMHLSIPSNMGSNPKM